MISYGAPDLLTSGLLARRTADVRADIDIAARELATGRKADLVAASGGDPTRLYALERDVALVDGRLSTLGLAAGRATVMQASLAEVQSALDTVGARLLAAVRLDDASSADRVASEARSDFGRAVAALNSRFGNRTLFAGAGVDGPATAPADAILAEVAALTAGAADGAAAVAIVDAYFSDPAGFAATGYAGSATNAPEIELAPGERIAYAPRADDVAARDALAALALAVVGVEGAFAGADRSERMAVLEAAGARGLAAVETVVSARSALGVAEERIDVALVRAEAQRTVFATALNDITARDPFAAAADLTALETQLQSIFTVTARLSGLKLSNYLR